MLVSFVHQLDNNRLSIGYVSISDKIVANNDIESSKHEEISSSRSEDNRITLSIKRNSYRLFFPRLVSHVLLTKEQDFSAFRTFSFIPRENSRESYGKIVAIKIGFSNHRRLSSILFQAAKGVSVRVEKCLALDRSYCVFASTIHANTSNSCQS